MAKWMILDLGVSLAAYEANGPPKWVKDKAFPLGDVLPEGKIEGRVLVYASNSDHSDDAGYTYVGLLFGQCVDDQSNLLRFDAMDAIAHVPTGLAGDESPANAERPERARFTYIDEVAARRVMREGHRRTFRMSPSVVNSLPGFSIEYGHRSEDEAVEEALRAYYESKGWPVGED